MPHPLPRMSRTAVGRGTADAPLRPAPLVGLRRSGRPVRRRDDLGRHGGARVRSRPGAVAPTRRSAGGGDGCDGGRELLPARGVDWGATRRALEVNLRAGKVKQGGSTITQQLAKNLFLSNARTLGRKVPEAFLAFALERRLSKYEILALYVNSIPYGMGRIGRETLPRSISASARRR